MNSTNKRNKQGKASGKDSIPNTPRPAGPSREPTSSPSITSSPIPGGASVVQGFNGTVPKYIYDFSKALAGEVRILLAEVGQLRDERRQLQYEIAEIMALKSKHAGSGGDYGGIPGNIPYDHPDALAYAMAGLALPPPGIDPNLALAPLEPAAPPPPAPPAWRTVHKRAERKPRSGKKSVPQAIPTPSQVPPLEVPRPNVPAWSQWRPNPLLSPTPQQGAFPNAPTPPPRTGLFGPPSPPPK